MSDHAVLRRVILIAAMFAGAFAAPALAQQQAATWSMPTTMPRDLYELQATTVGGKIYIVGGAWDEMKDGKLVEHLNDGLMTEFDPQANTWRERTRGPEGLTHQGIAVLNGKIYLAGEFAGGHHTLPTASFFSYDPATDKWQTLAPLPAPRGAIALAAVGGMIHAISGRIMGEEGTIATHDVYNPATNSWHAATPLQTSRDHAGVFVVDGKIHIIGGRTGESTTNVGLHDVYDPATDKWTSAPPMITPRSSGAFVEYHGMLFIAGGECNMGKTFDQVEAYDIKNNRWVSFPPLPAGRHGFAAAVGADKLFFFGGATRCGGTVKLTDALQLTPH